MPLIGRDRREDNTAWQMLLGALGSVTTSPRRLAYLVVFKPHRHSHQYSSTSQSRNGPLLALLDDQRQRRDGLQGMNRVIFRWVTSPLQQTTVQTLQTSPTILSITSLLRLIFPFLAYRPEGLGFSYSDRFLSDCRHACKVSHPRLCPLPTPYFPSCASVYQAGMRVSS